MSLESLEIVLIILIILNTVSFVLLVFMWLSWGKIERELKKTNNTLDYLSIKLDAIGQLFKLHTNHTDIALYTPNY